MSTPTRLPRIEPAALAGSHPPELVNRFFDILTVQKGITKLLIDLMFAGFQILFGVVVLTFYHPVFIALGLFTVLALVLGYWLHYRHALRTSIAESAGKYALVAWLQQVAGELPAYRHHPARLAQATDRADALTAGYLQDRNGHFRVCAALLYLRRGAAHGPDRGAAGGRDAVCGVAPDVAGPVCGGRGHHFANQQLD